MRLHFSDIRNSLLLFWCVSAVLYMGFWHSVNPNRHERQMGQPGPTPPDLGPPNPGFCSGQRKCSRNVHENQLSLFVTNEDIDKFRMTIPSLPNYKNPCWVEHVPYDFSYRDTFYISGMYKNRNDKGGRQRDWVIKDFIDMNTTLQQRLDKGEHWRMRCYPYFFLIGVARSGTTALLADISKYIHEFTRGALKELHYWEALRDVSGPRAEQAKKTKVRPTFSHYIDTFDKAAEEIRKSEKYKAGRGYHPLFTGDATPSTLTNDNIWKSRPGNERLSEPKYIIANYLYHLRPETKYIVIMREPAERLWSNFLMKIRINDEKHISPYTVAMFPAMVRRSIKALDTCISHHTLRSCLYNNTDQDFARLLYKSMYVVYLQDWLRVIPKKQFLFLSLEEFKKNKLHTIGDVIRFLDASPLTEEDEHSIALEQKQLNEEKPSVSPQGVLDSKTRELLHQFYRPYNHQLAKLLGDKAFTWGY